MLENQKNDMLALTCDLIAAYVTNNSVPVGDLPSLIPDFYAALAGLSSKATQNDTVERPTTAQIRKSVTPHGLVSFIDGKSYKTLKRHLKAHGLDPHSYRQRYGLSADYPMVAAVYAAKRSDLAKAIGLGRFQALATSGPAKEEPQQKVAQRKKTA